MDKQSHCKKRTLREEGQMICRAIGLIQKELPSFWVNQILCTFVSNLSPYFGLYMSARMINELAGNREVRTLLVMAGITVIGGFLLSLFTRLLQGRVDLIRETMGLRIGGIFGNGQNEFKYEHLENAEIVLQRSKIFADMDALAAGLVRITWSIPNIIGSMISIIFSIALTISMFTMTANGEFSGFFGFVNSGFSTITIVCLIGINAAGYVLLSRKKAEKVQMAIGGLGKENTWLLAIEALRGPDMIAFGLNHIVNEEFRKKATNPKWLCDSEQVSIRYGRIAVLQEAVMNIVIFLYTAAKAYIGVFGIGNFILYQGTVQRFVRAVSDLAKDMGELLHNNNYLAEMYEFLDLPNDMYKGTLAVEKREDIDYEVEFRDVSFKYPRTDIWALRHVNMKFKIGEKLAVVGENGSGKTTFIKLLCRLYDPTEGKILLNGIDITRYRYHEYMALFSVVFQDYTLFGFPLGENVSADNTYDPAKVRDCLIRAGMGEKLAGLDREAAEAGVEGKDPLQCGIGRDYDSEGIDFSGGEKQKIALARALYKDAPFVILDEPTAALDPIAEAEVYENFNKIVENKTAVFISHRLSSCKFCHKIAVFDKGQLVQKGSHDELVAEELGKYSQLWHAQAKYYA